MQHPKPPIVFWACLWLVPLAVPFVYAVHDMIVGPVGTWWGRDFSNVWLGGQLALAGGDPYNEQQYTSWIRAHGIAAAQSYSYPPHTLLVAAPLSLLPYPLGMGVWSVSSTLLLFFAAKPLVPFNPKWLICMLAFMPLSGQYGGLTSALWLWSFQDNQARAGVASGLLTVKPHLGILLAPLLLVKRRWLQIATACLCAGAAILASEIAFHLWAAFFSEAVPHQTRILTDRTNQPYFLGMGSAFVALRHTPFAWAAQAAAALCALAILSPIIRTVGVKDLCFPLATATFIVLPYSFDYDMTVVSLGFAVMIYARWAELSRLEIAIASLACIAPSLTATRLVPLILLAGLAVQVKATEFRKLRAVWEH